MALLRRLRSGDRFTKRLPKSFFDNLLTCTYLTGVCIEVL